MSQRQILENAIDLTKTLRGPAKILYASPSVGFPTMLENIINPTTGAPGASWLPFGLTRGGVNIGKTIDITVRDDVDQIMGAYDQDVTDRSYQLTTQIAEVLYPQRDLAMSMDLDSSATILGTVATQSMRFLDTGANKTGEWRWAVVYPKATDGKVYAFVFRRGAVSGGEKAFRFDKSDPASPPLEVRMFPEIATTIDSKESYGKLFEIL